MANRQLTADEVTTLFRPLMVDTISRLEKLSGGDPELLWALRRKLAKELSYLERSKPMERKALKLAKRLQQANKCALCGGDLPERGAILDRLQAMAGYTMENTRLLCRDCDWKLQEKRGFA